MIARSTIDRLTITALLMTATLPFAALSPVKAGTTITPPESGTLCASA